MKELLEKPFAEIPKEILSGDVSEEIPAGMSEEIHRGITKRIPEGLFEDISSLIPVKSLKDFLKQPQGNS